MELNWLSQEGFNFDQLDAVSNDVASPAEGTTGVEGSTVPSPRDATFSHQYVGDLDFLPDDMDFNDIFNEDMKKPLMHNDGSDMLSGTTLNKHFENLPDISLSSILNSSSSTVTSAMEPNRVFVVNTATKQISAEGQEAVAAQYNTRSTHQRKAAPGKRVVAQSPYQSQQEAVKEEEEEEDVKPNVSQLASTYGLRRKRNLSTISTDDAPTSSRNSKKPRKYEIEDVNDPSVRNAKAAKLNRDRKKREFNEMKKRAEAAEATVASLRVENDSLKTSLASVSGQLNDLKVKNRTVTGLNCQMSTMKNVFEAILPAMSQKFGRQMAVEVPDSFAQIPAALDERGELIGGGAGGLNPDGFNILDESFQMGVGEQTDMAEQSSQPMNSNYFTLHINPQGGKIRLDYDPSFQ
ncbi:uncharacterized protein LOC110848262 [Folsomia candida]|uniref:uncharacterized protein LOC110848262 n=1 Tax=Folsomia candida TaxID=158441 RepID=UPI000B8F630B|nr:uncharacterized protein LOC110848262 [Folsomia candida]